MSSEQSPNSEQVTEAKLTKQDPAIQNTAAETESKLQKFLADCRDAVVDGTFLRLTLGKSQDSEDLKSLRVFSILVKGQPTLSFVYHHTTKDITKNYDPIAGTEILRNLIGAKFYSATLFTSKNDLTIEYSRKRVAQLRSSGPSLSQGNSASHNREKNYLVPLTTPFLKLLGITDKNDRLSAASSDKFRQINKFIEIIDTLIPESWRKGTACPRIIDFGSGKSYLTFAVYDYFTRVIGAKCSITGIELREELVISSRKIARELAYDGLEFSSGAISNYNLQEADLVIALHACDTATDDAILASLKARAQLIILAPCCHKYLRKKIKTPEALAPIFKHGILEEGLAVSLTDGLRALFLEQHGYKARVFEFISSEFTSKNTMITGKLAGVSNRSEGIKSQISAIKAQFEISDFYLDREF